MMAIGLAVAVGAFELVYSTLSAPLFAYMGWAYHAPTAQGRFAMWAACMLPALWMPLYLRRPSQILYWLSFLFVYVPSVEMLFFLSRLDFTDSLLYAGTLTLCYGIAGLSYVLPVSPFALQTWDERSFLRIILFIFGVGILLNIAAYGPQMRFVGFGDRIEHRLNMRQVETNIVIDYAMAHIAWGISPMLMALGLSQKKPLWFLIGAAGEAVLYGASASRAFALTVVFIPGIYFVSWFSKGRVGLWLPWFVGLSFLAVLAIDQMDPDLGMVAQQVYFDRSYVVPGWSTCAYAEFFSKHPYTYGSHLRGINLLVEYPYDLPLNFLMGEYLTGDVNDSENGNLWADGIATAGPVGLLLIAVLLAFVFWLIDSAAAGLDPKLTAVVIAAYSIPMINISLPTTLVGGGLAFMILVLSLMPRFGQAAPATEGQFH